MTGTSWQKSSFSGPDNNPDCIELAAVTDSILIRESDAPEPIIRTTRIRLDSLITRLKNEGLR
ncbi:DUF397 domain-containing protein [Streptomyces sp. NPDC053048]|uniref:DUF397 domain-containing protein n=1 Tax=Streptomyces sp. NPDC053048 TaxID=3365694 RepID=UPI0037D021F3